MSDRYNLLLDGDGSSDSSGSSGSSGLGVLLRQSGETAKGLFLSASGVGLEGHGVGQSSGATTPASGSHVDLPNNGGGPGVGRHASLRLAFPADITDYAGAASNNIVVRLNRLDAVAASPVVAWDSSTGILTITVGATTTFGTVETVIGNFSDFAITTSIVGTGDGSDVFRLGADATGANYAATGGRDEIPPQVELLAEPDATPPRILVKYDPAVHTTLQGIWDELAVNDQNVTITVPHGTDLSAAPEGVPWDRGIDAGLGGSGSGIEGVVIEDEGTPLDNAATSLDFVGPGVTASGTGSTKTVTISDAGTVETDDDTLEGDGSSSDKVRVKAQGIGTDELAANSVTTGKLRNRGVTEGKLAADVVAKIDGALQTTGGTMTGKITLDGDPTANLHAATKAYVDANAAPGGGSSDFDLHDDVTSEATALNADGLDRFLISQEGIAHDPNAWISSTNVREGLKGYVGAWEATPAGFIFRVGDVTEYNDQWYFCRAENTKPANGPDTDPTHWQPVTTFAGAWATGNWWHKGTVVTHSTHLWFALEDVVDTDAAPGTSAKWVQIDGSIGTPPNAVVLFADESAPMHPVDVWRAATLSRTPQPASQVAIRLSSGSRGTVGLIQFPAREWLDLPVLDNTGSGATGIQAGEQVLALPVFQVGDNDVATIPNDRAVVVGRYSDTSMAVLHTDASTQNATLRIIEYPNAGQTVDVSAARTDTLVFYSPTSGHAAFDALDFGSTVTYAYGSSETDALVLSASRVGTVCTLVLEPSDGWASAFSQAAFELQDSADAAITTLTVASRADARADVDSPGEWYSELEALTGGEEVWRDIARIDTEDNTHLSLGTRTATTVPINSSTGDPVTIPAATATEAGVESAEDKTQLTALPPTWAGARVWPAGSHCAYQGRTYKATTQREITDTDPPTSDAAWVDVGAGGETNLTIVQTATQVTVESDTGTNAVIPAATDSVAGAYPGADRERVQAGIDKWADGAHTVGQQRVWNEAAYVCIADTSPGDDNPATDTTGWAPLGRTPDLSGYVEDADIVNFRTATQITTQVTNAVSDRLIDGGAYDATDAYAAGTVVRNDGATYLSLIAVGANTGATTEPGVGTDWETSWFRVGFEDGPPNAFINAGLSGDNLTFTREGGTNPLSVDIGGVTGGSTLRVETLGLLSTASDIAVPTQDWVQVSNFEESATVAYGAGSPEIVERDTTDTGELTFSPGVYEILIEGWLTQGSDERASPIFEFHEAGSSPSSPNLIHRTNMAYVRNRTDERDNNYDSDGDGTVDVGAAPFWVRSLWVQNVERTVDFYAGSDPWTDGISSNAATVAGDGYSIIHESLKISIMRPGSGNPVVNNVFNPMDIGTDTFDLNGSATQVALTDDTSGEAIVIPDSGYILTITTVPGLGLRGAVQLHLAEDLQVQTMESGLQAQFYTNTDNELIFGAAAQTGGTATMGNKIIVQRVGSTTESTSGATPVINPSILRFDVTGENHPSVASIAGDVFDIVGEISQSGHVGSADVVGFAGTAHDPSVVSTLLSDAQITASGGYHHFTGRLTIPVGTELTNVGDIYTIRLRVWPTGGDTSVAPTIYHDYRITRVASAAVTHFGHMPFLRSGSSVHTDASDLADFTNDFSTAGSAIGNWTITGLAEGDGERRLYWAVPATDTQPAVWINDGSTVTDIIDVPSGAQDIGGTSYLVYVTNRQFDDFANGITYTTRSS